MQESEAIRKFIEYYMEQLRLLLSHPLMAQIIYSALAFIIGVAVLKTVNNMLKKMVQRNIISQSAYVRIHNVLSIVIYSLILLIIISLFTANIYLVLAIIGFLLILAYSAKSLYTNIISYYAILLGRIIVIGDMIKIGDVIGKVRNIGALYTEIKTRDGSIVKIPNSLFLEQLLKIYSELFAVKILVHVEAPFTIEDIEDKIMKAISSYKGIVKISPDIRVHKLTGSAAEFEVTVYTTSPEKVEQVFSDIAKELLRELGEYMVEIVRLNS